jgi:hypothetical protein
MKIERPSSDFRYRTCKSEKLWLAERRVENGELKSFGIFGSAERVVYSLNNGIGQYVQYDNKFYQLHSRESLENILNLAKMAKINFFNNEVGYGGAEYDDIKHWEITEVAPFIFYNEKISDPRF